MMANPGSGSPSPPSPRRPSLAGAAAAAFVILGGVRCESSPSRCAIARAAAVATSSFVVVPAPGARPSRRRRRDDDRCHPYSSHSSSLAAADDSSSSIDGGRTPLSRVGNFAVVDDDDDATGVWEGAVPRPPDVDDDEDDDEGASSRPSSLVERVEGVPIGMLTRKEERNILSVMRRLSSDMGRRRDDVVVAGRGGKNDDDDDDDDAAPDGRRRRRDATIVERLSDRLLGELKHVAHDDDIGPTRDDVARRARMVHNLAIRAWANTCVRGSAERTERLLKRMTLSHDVGAGPDVYSFAHCYAAWYRESLFGAARTTDDDDSRASTLAMRRAENVLSSMKRFLMRGDGRKGLSSDRSSDVVEDVNSLLAAWSSTDVDLPELSEKFVRFLADQWEVDGGGEAWVNVRSYNLIINGEFLPFFIEGLFLSLESNNNLESLGE
jgi:hypothetical protein